MEDARYEFLGHLVYNQVPEEAGKILLYVEFPDDGVVSHALFCALSDGALLYVETQADIAEELFRLQELFGSEVKAMEFAIEGDSFSTRFVYADKFDASADNFARRDAVLQRHFGHAKVRYPSL